MRHTIAASIHTRTNRKTKKDPLVYVATPQRLDQNTSGLFVAATTKSFAAYFAKLLRKKTDKFLKDQNANDTSLNGYIQKKYRCLVCINGGLTCSKYIKSMKSMIRGNPIHKHYVSKQEKKAQAIMQKYISSFPSLLFSQKSVKHINAG